MQPDLVQHAREVHHAARHFVWAFRISRHKTNETHPPWGCNICSCDFHRKHSERGVGRVIVWCGENRTEIPKLHGSRKSRPRILRKAYWQRAVADSSRSPQSWL